MSRLSGLRPDPLLFSCHTRPVLTSSLTLKSSERLGNREKRSALDCRAGRGAGRGGCLLASAHEKNQGTKDSTTGGTTIQDPSRIDCARLRRCSLSSAPGAARANQISRSEKWGDDRFLSRGEPRRPAERGWGRSAGRDFFGSPKKRLGDGFVVAATFSLRIDSLFLL